MHRYRALDLKEMQQQAGSRGVTRYCAVIGLAEFKGFKRIKANLNA